MPRSANYIFPSSASTKMLYESIIFALRATTYAHVTRVSKKKTK
jgi:hypothetical protein